MTEQEYFNNNQLSLDIWNNKYRYNNESFDEWLDRVSNKDNHLRECIKNKKFLFGGRILANRGLNNGATMSNCYSRGFVEDSLKDILQVGNDIAMTFKAQGGQGLSLSKIRPKGTMIKDLYTSDGIVPWMHLYNTITDSISQGGSRKGGLIISLDITHKEAETFIIIKDDLNKINKANLSLEINDEFMNWVVNGETSVNIHRIYDSGEIDYTINPTALYNLLIYQAWKVAEPGVLFMNKFRNYNLMEFIDEYQIETCNLCGEQPLPKNLSCNLSSINLSEYVIYPFTDNAYFNEDSFIKDIYYYIEAMDDIIEENINNHALPEQREMTYKYRNIGLGVMGEADMLIKMKIKYGLEESSLIDKIHSILFKTAVKASVKLAQERGAFPGYKAELFNSTIIKNHFTQEEINEMKSIGMRNSSLISIAPTGSISTMLNISGGIEPIFAFSHKRRTENINGGEEYQVYSKIVQDYFKLFSDKTILPDYFVSAYDINWKNRIALQSTIQYHTDCGISSTINLSKDTKLEEIYELYIEAWKAGLKGCTIYVDGSRQGILTIDNDENKSIPLIHNRPKELPVDIHNVKIKGEDWTVLVGLLNDKPYELFTFKNKNVHLSEKIQNAKLIKDVTDKGNLYHLQSDEIIIQDLPSWYSTGEEEFTTRLISRMMRNNYDLNIIINDAEKTNKSIGTFVNVLKRVLSKYIKSKQIEDICPECGNKLIKTEGCMKCTCGYSKCG